jgi:hypothetical protein
VNLSDSTSGLVQVALLWKALVMRGLAFVLSMTALLVCNCSSSPAASSGEASCSTSIALIGASYDLSKSRFAFGSTPTKEVVSATLVRWVGSDGDVAIESNGSEAGVMNGGAPQSTLASWSSDTSAVNAHASDYWVSMGVQRCQIGEVSDSYGAGDGTPAATPRIARAIDGIAVVESLAVAHFDIDDQTTEESLYWPEIPADVVSAAVAFRSQVGTPAALAAYKAKLPSWAQGKGQIVIHHTSQYSFTAFTAAATYDVTESTSQDDGGPVSFDETGKRVTTTW